MSTVQFKKVKITSQEKGVSYILTKKAQTWYMDFIFGIFIFTICLILYFKFVPNLDSQELENLYDVYYDAKTISDSLMSEGYPADWNKSQVQRIGILSSGNKVNRTKLINLKNMTDNNYNNTRRKFNIMSDFVLFFKDTNDNPINISDIYHIGHPDVTLQVSKEIDFSGISNDNLVSISRIVRNNQTLIKMVVYTWY